MFQIVTALVNNKKSQSNFGRATLVGCILPLCYIALTCINTKIVPSNMEIWTQCNTW